MNEGLKFWNDMMVSNSWQIFHFWVNYPFNVELYFSLTSRGRYRLCCGQVEAVVDIRGQQIVVAMMVLVSL